jgi:hypothetical protein
MNPDPGMYPSPWAIHPTPMMARTAAMIQRVRIGTSPVAS